MTKFTPEFKEELLAFIKENVSLQISESSSTVDRSYGEYCDKTTFTIKLVVADEVISEESIYHYGS